ncbi:hypothetical protein [Emticicia sp. 17c]|uniref:hypothetical protein n=1 Tax=Emticicia sp. 17c TaxID=3127704 RepID=UPI00301D9A98
MKLTIANYPLQIQNFDWNKLPPIQKEVFQTMKDGSGNFMYWDEWASDFDVKPVLLRHIEIINNIANKPGGIEKKVVTKTTKKTAIGPPKKMVVPLAVKHKKTPKKTEQQKLDELRKEVETLRLLVISNAKFKNKLGDEVKAYLQSKGLNTRVGLGSTSDAIKILKEKKKFYSFLLNGDTTDFKVIARRLGILYRSTTIKKK